MYREGELFVGDYCSVRRGEMRRDASGRSVQREFVRMRVKMDRPQSQFVRDTRAVNNALV